MGYIDKVMSMFSKEKDKKTKTQNLIFLVIMLVFALICINTVFSNDSVKTMSENKEDDKNSNKIEESNYNSTEKNLQKILSEVSGISDVSVMITYSSEEKIVPVYDIKEDITIEENGNSNDSSKKSKKTTTEKTVAYEEIDGKKVAIVESKKSPDIIGAIITGRGINSETSVRIKEAVSNALDIPQYKVEVFSK